jgi:MFS family permease
MIWGSFLCVTVTYGGVVSFTPFVLPASGAGSAPLFLFLFGLTRMTARVGSGRLIDRLGDRRLVLPSLAVGVVGLVLLALNSSAAVTIAAAVLYGGAFGITQTGCFVGMLRATHGSRPNVVSGFWNVAIDAGVGTGALALAPIGSAVGFTRMLWLLPALLVLSMAGRAEGVGRRGRGVPEREVREQHHVLAGRIAVGQGGPGKVGHSDLLAGRDSTVKGPKASSSLISPFAFYPRSPACCTGAVAEARVMRAWTRECRMGCGPAQAGERACGLTSARYTSRWRSWRRICGQPWRLAALRLPSGR